MKAGKLLVDFSRPQVRAKARKRGVAAFAALDERGRPAGMEVFLGAARPGGIVLDIPGDIADGDWAGFQTLALELENRGPNTVRVGIALQNDRGRGLFDRTAEFTVEMPAGIRTVWRVPIQQLRYSRGWWSPWGIPRQPDLGEIRFQGLMDSRRIRQVRIFLSRGRQVAALVFYRLTLKDPISPERWVDKFGQRSAMSWPMKLKRDRDIIKADRLEERELARSRPFPERDEYQAWWGARPRDATGFFRVEKVDGRWWFVAPNGRLYYACGLDVVICGIDARMDPAVEEAYSWLPGTKGEFAAAWSGRGMSLYRANLIRKWGADGFRRRYLVRAVRRQLAWGFTSTGNWSDPAQFPLRRLPYFSVGPNTGAMKVPYAAKKIHDAFHPDFERESARAAAGLSALSDDPFLVGHFVDNEVDWAGLPRAVAGARSGSPARRRLIERLRRRYRTVSRLNSAWGTKFASFERLQWPAASGGKPASAAERDLADFRGEFAERWFKIWAGAVHRADPNHLVLGSRLHQGNRPPEVISACARHMDVVSMNHYEIEANAAEFAGYYRIAKKPLLIGEYGHNSLDAGLLTAAVPVADQAARAVGYRYYTERLAAQPYFVGGHYFQYLDEPITGRFDRETGFNGFVNIADIPYPRLVKAAKASHARIYRVHAGVLGPYGVRPEL